MQNKPLVPILIRGRVALAFRGSFPFSVAVSPAWGRNGTPSTFAQETMAISRIWVDASQIAVWFGVPFLLLVWPRRPAWPRHLGARIFATVMVVWVALIAHRLLTLPILIEAVRRSGESNYDGVGGNVGIILTGWLFALIACVPCLILRSFFVREKLPTRLRLPNE